MSRYFYELSTELINKTYRVCYVVWDRQQSEIVMKVYDENLIDNIIKDLNQAPT